MDEKWRKELLSKLARPRRYQTNLAENSLICMPGYVKHRTHQKVVVGRMRNTIISFPDLLLGLGLLDSGADIVHEQSEKRPSLFHCLLLPQGAAAAVVSLDLDSIQRRGILM